MERHVTWAEVEARVRAITERAGRVTGVFGIPRGGCVPAALAAGVLGVPLLEAPAPECIVLDDLTDSGRTLDRYRREELGFPTLVRTLYRKDHSPEVQHAETVPSDTWLVFPWEVNETPAADAVVRLLEHLGEDPTRDGLLATPDRVVRALSEMTDGYSTDVAALLGCTFDVSCDEMVVVDGIDFTSLCEHHLLPFVGTAVVGYIPGERVVGLSKLARLVDAYAHRLQVQERMTAQIADALVEHLQPGGVGVVLRARHGCMGCRGVRKPSASMVTSALRGAIKDDGRARAEFMGFVPVG